MEKQKERSEWINGDIWVNEKKWIEQNQNLFFTYDKLKNMEKQEKWSEWGNIDCHEKKR